MKFKFKFNCDFVSCYKKTGDIPRTVKEGTLSGPRLLFCSMLWTLSQSPFLERGALKIGKLLAEKNMDANLECSRNCSDFNRTEEVTCFEEGVRQSLLHSYSIPCFRLDSTMETTLTTSLPGTPRIARCNLSKDQPNIDRCLFYRLVVRRTWAVSPSPSTQAMPSVI